MSQAEYRNPAAEIKKIEKLVLYCFLWVQIIHTTYFLLISGIESVTLPLWTLSIERFLASLVVLSLLIKVRAGIGHRRTWTWGILILLAVNVLCFAAWYWRHEDSIPKVFLAVQLVLVPLALFVLVKRRTHFQVTMRSIPELVAALGISIATVYLRSQYFATNQVDWAIDPPFYFRRLVYSNFHWPQENSLALLLVSYLAVTWIFRTGRLRIR